MFEGYPGQGGFYEKSYSNEKSAPQAITRYHETVESVDELHTRLCHYREGAKTALDSEYSDVRQRAEAIVTAMDHVIELVEALQRSQSEG